MLSGRGSGRGGAGPGFSGINATIAAMSFPSLPGPGVALNSREVAPEPF